MEKKCTACGAPLRFATRENLQLGKTGWILGDLPNLLAGALDIEIWACPVCRKLAFYWPEAQPLPGEEEENRMSQVACPFCGQMHDLDDVWCPHCDRRLDGAE